MFRETCHPPWPSRLVGLVVVAVPLELPEFLDGHMLDGVIHEHPLDTAIVPVHGKMFHLGVKTAPFTVVSRGRHARSEWPATAPHHVHEHRDLMQVMAGWIHGAPVPCLAAALDISLSIVEPVVVTVTSPGGNGLKRDATMLEGGIPAADCIPTISLVFIYRIKILPWGAIAPCQFKEGAQQDILLAPEFLQ